MPRANHFADRLFSAIKAKGAPVCVGIDPVLDRLPEPIRDATPHAAVAFQGWGLRLLEAVAPHTPAVKFQSACFERYGSQGVAALEALCEFACELGLIVILDAKRGDIGISAEHYAVGLLAGPVDALTVAPYMGPDTIQPFADRAAEQGKGIFVLVRTSNPGSDALQNLPLHDGRLVGEAVADMVAELGESSVGKSNYSSVGAVVGATKPAEIANLRGRMEQQVFLVPGYGAQGGSAADVKACFDRNGRGAIITASRSVIYAQGRAKDWTNNVATAAKKLNTEIARLV